MANKKDETIHVTFDAETGETFERSLTANEITEREQMAASYAEQQAEQEAKVAAKASALAKLKKLGLTAAEIEAL